MLHCRSEILKYNCWQKNSRWEALEKDQKMLLQCVTGRSTWNASFFNNATMVADDDWRCKNENFIRFRKTQHETTSSAIKKER